MSVKKLQRRLGYVFKDTQLLAQALTHKSTNNKNNNERLEFLGDAVLDLIIGEYVFNNFPNIPEGDLSKTRAALVNEKSFSRLARELKIGEYLNISLGEEHNGGRQKASLLSDAFEAVMGALYLDAGLEFVRDFVIKLLERSYKNINAQNIFKDFKSNLQEFTQARFGTVPTYELIASKGPDHHKEFFVSVKINNKIISKGRGTSKKIAQQMAAQKALKALR